jgi:hypothetical protein
MSESADGFVDHICMMVNNFLKLSGDFTALMRGKISFTADISGYRVEIATPPSS